jgi:hypothetical protein
MARLTHERVENILQGYKSKEVTDELYDMGKMLLEECTDRVSHLDSKAAKIAGYSGAIIALMISTFPIWTSAVDRWAVGLVGFGTLIGLFGAAIALASTWPQTLDLPSDSDWIEEDGLNDPDRLKRYYISSLHISIASHEAVNARKVLRIKRAQGCLAVMVLLLAVALGNASYKATKRPVQPVSGHADSMGGGLFYPR